MSEQHKCPARVSSGAWFSTRTCGRNAAYEHEGVHYCKTHHPPTVKAKDEARRAAWHVKWDQEAAYSKRKREEAAEQKRRADLYPELLAVLEAALPFIDDAGDIAQFYPDSSATDKCRAAVKQARAVLARATHPVNQS